MKNTTIADTVEQKKKSLALKLENLKQHWPFADKQEWCIKNGYNVDSINKGYLRGTIGSIVVAEKLVEVISQFIKDNNIAA